MAAPNSSAGPQSFLGRPARDHLTTRKQMIVGTRNG
jgi:hypothetical protein